MDQDTMKHLDAELAHAGEETTLSPLMLQLEQLRITPDRELPPMDFLFRLFDKPCFPRHELVGITGKAKSGKTFLTSMLIACCQTSDILALHRSQPLPLRVLWYDTEQSDESTQDILKNRIMRLQTQQTHPTSLDVFNVRAVEWKLRRKMLAEAVRRCHPDIAIVDGIRDLVNDINDGVLAQEVMEELLQLATECNCCIVCVLHQNKSGEDHNLRGWIGTELMNKAFEVYSCEKLMPERIFRVEQTLTRKYDIERDLYFQVGASGLPVASGAPADSSKDDKETFPQLNASYIIHNEHDEWKVDVRRLFTDAIGGRQQMTGGELRQEVCRLSNIRSWSFYNSLLGQAVNSQVIMKSYDHASHVIYALRPPEPVQTELYQDDAPF